MSQSIDYTTSRRFHDEFKNDPKNVALENSLTKINLMKACRRFNSAKNSDFIFSDEVEVDDFVSDQYMSGRCWSFASLSLLMTEMKKKYKLYDFEFSHSYVAFWDKYEKANKFLCDVIETRNLPPDDRKVELVFSEPVADGGQINMFVNVVEKYGLVPKSVYPETKNSSDTRHLNHVLNIYLRNRGVHLRKMPKKTTKKEMYELKEEYMQNVYNILAMSMGNPPLPTEKFKWTIRRDIRNMSIVFSDRVKKDELCGTGFNKAVNKVKSYVGFPSNNYNDAVECCKGGGTVDDIRMQRKTTDLLSRVNKVFEDVMTHIRTHKQSPNFSDTELLSFMEEKMNEVKSMSSMNDVSNPTYYSAAAAAASAATAAAASAASASSNVKPSESDTSPAFSPSLPKAVTDASDEAVNKSSETKNYGNPFTTSMATEAGSSVPEPPQSLDGYTDEFGNTELEKEEFSGVVKAPSSSGLFGRGSLSSCTGFNKSEDKIAEKGPIFIQDLDGNMREGCNGDFKVYFSSFYDTKKKVQRNKDIMTFNMTPKDFYFDVVPCNLGSFATVVNDPRKEHPLNEMYVSNDESNVMGMSNFKYLNVSPADLKRYVIKCILADKKCWVALDIHRNHDKDMSLLDNNVFDMNAILNEEVEDLSKEDLLRYHESRPNHAVLITGVDIAHVPDEHKRKHCTECKGRGKKCNHDIVIAKKFKIQNSWGPVGEGGGIITMSDNWFDTNVYQAVVPYNLLTPEHRKTYRGKIYKTLPPGDLLSSKTNY